MRNTLVTVEPAGVTASLVDGRVSIGLETDDVRVHLQRSLASQPTANEPVATVRLVAADRDLRMTVEFARAEVDALVDGLQVISGGDTHD